MHTIEGVCGGTCDGRRKWLIRIQDWTPRWQAVYYYRKPVFLPKGSLIKMAHHYDNSANNASNPSRPPQRVLGGNPSTDEMGHLWLQLLPRGPFDRRREIAEALMRHRLTKDPGDFGARVTLGTFFLPSFKPGGAVTMLEEAVRLRPSQPERHNWLGVAREVVGRTREAIVQYEWL